MVRLNTIGIGTAVDRHSINVTFHPARICRMEARLAPHTTHPNSMVSSQLPRTGAHPDILYSSS